MLHGACGALNTNAPCIKDGVCTKRYPRNLHNETQKAEMGIHCIEEGHERMAESEFSDFKSVVFMSKLLQLLVTTHILMYLLI